MNGQYLLRKEPYQQQDDNHRNQQFSQLHSTNQNRQSRQLPNNDSIQEQYESNQRYQNFQSLSSVNQDIQSISGKLYNLEGQQPDFIEQSQTDTEYLEEIKRLVQGRQSQQNNSVERNNEMHRDNYDTEIKFKQSKNKKSERNNSNSISQSRSGSSRSSSSNSSSENEEESRDNMNNMQFTSGSKAYTNKDIIDISDRLFQDGKLRQQKNSLKKIEQQLDQVYHRKQCEKKGMLSNNTKKIIEKKIQQGQYEPIHKRWDTLLQAKANKMLEANFKKEQIQKQLEEQQLTFKPEVNQQSSQMVLKRTPEQVVNALLTWNKRKLDRLFNQQMRESEKAVQELTFHPKINQVSAQMVGKNESEDVVKRLYKKMEVAETKKELMKQEEFQSKYTFKPKVNEKSAQIVQEQNFRSNMHLHHHERSLTPVYGTRQTSKGRKIGNNENQENKTKTPRSKTPTNYHSYKRSITPQMKNKKNNQSQQFVQEKSIIYEPNSKENRFTPICDSSNGRISQLFESNYLSQRGSLSQKSQVNLKKAEPMLEQSLNLTNQGIDMRSYSKGDRILQQNNKNLNTLQFSPQKSEGTNSVLKNYYSPSINSSFNTHSPDKINQHNSISQNNSKNFQNTFKSPNQNATLKFNEFMQQQEIQSNNSKGKRVSSQTSKSPIYKRKSDQNNLSKDNFNTSTSSKKKGQNDEMEYRSKTSLANKQNYDCCSTNPHVNVQEIEFNKKLQFLLDLLSNEEKRKYQSNAFN